MTGMDLFNHKNDLRGAWITRFILVCLMSLLVYMGQRQINKIDQIILEIGNLKSKVAVNTQVTARHDHRIERLESYVDAKVITNVGQSRKQNSIR